MSEGTTARVLSLLRLLAESGRALGVKSVADALGLPMSTSHRLLDALVEAGFVEKDPMQRRYHVGREFFRIANLVTQTTTPAAALQPVLNGLTAQTGETAILSLYLPAQQTMTHAAKCDTPEALRYRVALHERMPLEWGATGLAILAFLPEETRAAIFARASPSPVSGDTLTREAFEARIAAVRRDGYAMSEGEKVPESVGIAVPLESAPGTVFGSLALTIPQIRFDRSKIRAYADLLREAAQRFSRADA